MPAGAKKIKVPSVRLVCKNMDCTRMGRYQTPENFYKSINPQEPYYPYCKACLDKMIDYSNLDNLKDFLKEIDKPFIVNVWDEVCSSSKDNLITKYFVELSHQKLGRLKWKDSIFEVSPEVKKTFMKIKESEAQNLEIPLWDDEWQGEYTKRELEYLNDYMVKTKNDFDISTANHEDYAKEIARVSLSKTKAYNKMMNDPSDENIRAYKSFVSLFDTLSKSAQFAESQRSANDVGLGSFGQIFDAVEKNNWVPIYVPDNDDIYDKLLKQFANIEKSMK